MMEGGESAAGDRTLQSISLGHAPSHTCQPLAMHQAMHVSHTSCTKPCMSAIGHAPSHARQPLAMHQVTHASQRRLVLSLVPPLNEEIDLRKIPMIVLVVFDYIK